MRQNGGREEASWIYHLCKFAIKQTPKESHDKLKNNLRGNQDISMGVQLMLIAIAIARVFTQIISRFKKKMWNPWQS